VDNLSQSLTYELEAHLEAMESNHEEIVKAIEDLKSTHEFLKSSQYQLV
jgi:hypothetical protein